MIAVSIIGYIESQDEQSVMISHLRNLIQYVHSNFLILIQYIMEKFPTETLQINVWANALSIVIQEKTKRRCSKNERLQTLKQNNDNLANVIKAFLTKATVERNKKDD
jgi:hypothetical protein